MPGPSAAARPMLAQWRSTPWVANTPVDDVPISTVLDRSVQIAVRGEGPMSQRELVPLTTAAHELLHGPTRDGAHRVFRGILGELDGREGVANLRGFSLSPDEGAFATNLLLSNTEAGFLPDHVTAGDPKRFEQAMVDLIPSVRVAKAQNTGWMDLGPRVSALTRELIASGPRATTAAAQEVALTTLHELQHSVTPPDARTIDDRHVWLEEGIAETLAWWPGRASALIQRMGGPAHAGDVIDPWTADPASVASVEYRQRHRTVQALLGMAGITPTRDDGTPDPGALERATRLLQGDDITGVARDLERAIGLRHGLDPSQVSGLRDRILDLRGDAVAASQLAAELEHTGRFSPR